MVTEVLPGDAYRVTQLEERAKMHYTTTAHVSQLKSWKSALEGMKSKRIPRRMERSRKDPRERSRFLDASRNMKCTKKKSLVKIN